MRKMVGILLVVLVIAILSFSIYVRLSPVHAADYDQSPKTAPSDGKQHEYRLINEDAPVFSVDAEKLASTTDEYILSQPRVKRIAGDLQSNVITYEARSFLMGYPDYVSVEVEAMNGDASRLNIFSRSRFGYSDMGANKKRVENWVSGIQAEISEK